MLELQMIGLHSELHVLFVLDNVEFALLDAIGQELMGKHVLILCRQQQQQQQVLLLCILYYGLNRNQLFRWTSFHFHQYNHLCLNSSRSLFTNFGDQGEDINDRVWVRWISDLIQQCIQ